MQDIAINVQPPPIFLTPHLKFLVPPPKFLVPHIIFCVPPPISYINLACDATDTLLALLELLDAFHAPEKEQGREIGVGHEQVMQKRERSFYIVDLWTATGIWIQPNQQIVAKSLAAYWDGLKEKLDEWMQDWLAKRQPAPNASYSLRQMHPNPFTVHRSLTV